MRRTSRCSAHLFPAGSGVVGATGSARARGRTARESGQVQRGRQGGAAVLPVLLLAGVLLVALNLRGPLVAVAPVVDDLRRDLDASGGTIGLLTSIPVLCFGLAAPLASLLIARTGVHRAVLVSMVGVLAGTVLRSLGGPTEAIAGTVVIGLGITVGNVVVPVVIGRDFPGATNVVTAAYTAALNLGSTLTSALTAPLADLVGWRTALAAWGLLVVAATAVWTAGLRRQVARTTAAPRAARPAGRPGGLAPGAGGGGAAGGGAPRGGAGGAASAGRAPPRCGGGRGRPASSPAAGRRAVGLAPAGGLGPDARLRRAGVHLLQRDGVAADAAGRRAGAVPLGRRRQLLAVPAARGGRRVRRPGAGCLVEAAVAGPAGGHRLVGHLPDRAARRAVPVAAVVLSGRPRAGRWHHDRVHRDRPPLPGPDREPAAVGDGAGRRLHGGGRRAADRGRGARHDRGLDRAVAGHPRGRGGDGRRGHALRRGARGAPGGRAGAGAGAGEGGLTWVSSWWSGTGRPSGAGAGSTPASPTSRCSPKGRRTAAGSGRCSPSGTSRTRSSAPGSAPGAPPSWPVSSTAASTP